METFVFVCVQYLSLNKPYETVVQKSIFAVFSYHAITEQIYGASRTSMQQTPFCFSVDYGMPCDNRNKQNPNFEEIASVIMTPALDQNETIVDPIREADNKHTDEGVVTKKRKEHAKKLIIDSTNLRESTVSVSDSHYEGSKRGGCDQQTK